MLAILIVASLAGCDGASSVPPIVHSSLSTVTPPAPGLSLADALAKPADFGSDWKLDVTSVGSTDYFVEYSEEAVTICKGANPARVGFAKPVEPAVSETLTSNSGGAYVWVRIALDSPAASADRLALIRAAYSHCSPTKYNDQGDRHTLTYRVRDAPAGPADESFAVQITDEQKSTGDPATKSAKTLAYARAGGVVLALSGFDVDPAQFLPAAVGRARKALRS